LAVTRTIRLPEALDSSLQNISETEKVSVNSVINRSLERFVEWDQLTEKFGFASVTRALLSRLLDYLTLNEVREVGALMAKDQTRSLILYSGKEITYSALLNLLQLGTRYSGLYKADYTIDKSKGKCIVVLSHSLGVKGSYFFESMLKTIFADLLKIPLETTVATDLCLAIFAFPE
jgi:hypothetical protein